MTGSIFLLGIFAVSIVSFAVRSISEEDRAARKDSAAADLVRSEAGLEKDLGVRSVRAS